MSIAIYHRIMRREGFEKAAKDLMRLVRDAQEMNPGEKRGLFLDIDGHRTEDGAFDRDMFELQKEFVLGFLMKYLSEVHMPLLSAENPHGQDNDVPLGLLVANIENKKDEELASLYIENYSNTEFASEKPVYEYLMEVSQFLSHVQTIKPVCRHRRHSDGSLNWRFYWHRYVVDLTTELFNSFIFGNLLSVSAMTRSLIESYAYMLIFTQYENTNIAECWLACSLVQNIRQREGSEAAEGLDPLLEETCGHIGISYHEAMSVYSRHENAWLSELLAQKRVTFRDICEHLGEVGLYDDYRYACSFIHGQDLTTKTDPFMLYVAICNKLFIMLDYVFRALELLLPESAELGGSIETLRDELWDLMEWYVQKAEGFLS